jgi:hypothetical protein
VDDDASSSTTQPHPARAIYFVSIIDLLQKYDLSKTMETKLKRGKSLKKGLLVSSVPSAEYGDRFIAFLKEVIPDYNAPPPTAAAAKTIKKRRWRWLDETHDGLQGLPSHKEVISREELQKASLALVNR